MNPAHTRPLLRPALDLLPRLGSVPPQRCLRVPPPYTFKPRPMSSTGYVHAATILGVRTEFERRYRMERRRIQGECSRAFQTTAVRWRDHHFDTLKFVERLKAEGFTEQQSEALLRIFSDVIEESIQNLARTMVPRDEHTTLSYTQRVDFAKLRNELTLLHNSELNPIRTDQERLSSEITRLGARLKEEVQRAQSSVKLDLNLEKGRIREESSVHELKVKETDTRIEKEVGDLRGMLEGVKFSTLQWLIGVCTGTAALLLGVWRLLM